MLLYFEFKVSKIFPINTISGVAHTPLIVVNVSKGLEKDSLKRLSKVLREELPESPIVVLSGPSHAEEVGRGIPTGCVAASVSPQTESFVRGFSGHSALILTETLVPMEKWKRDQLIPELRQWIAVLEAALTCRAGLPAVNPMAKTLSASRSSRELLAAIQALQKACDYAQGNVSTAAVCGWLAWALR